MPGLGIEPGYLVAAKARPVACGREAPKNQERYFPTMGILRPVPKALGVTRSTGGVW